VRDVQENKETPNEPLHPAISQPEQCYGKRSLAAGYGNDRGEAGYVALDAIGNQILDGNLLKVQAEAETDIRRCGPAAEEEKNLSR
jgi:hypothetical protein